MTSDTIEGPAGGFGKWGQAGVPHRGWTCIDIEDRGSPSDFCEMCEKQSIRFVHNMQHPNYPDVLGCGCDCAGHMEEDVEAAKSRDSRMRNAARRRLTFPNLRGWRRSKKGNAYIKSGAYLITIFEKDDGFGASIQNEVRKISRFARRTYSTARDAKLAAFDTMIFYETH